MTSMFKLHPAVSAISYHSKIRDYFATKIFLFSKDDWPVLCSFCDLIQGKTHDFTSITETQRGLIL